MTPGTAMVLVLVLLGAVAFSVLWYVWRSPRGVPVTKEKAEEEVGDRVEAVRSRAGTRMESMNDHEAIKEFEKNFGGPE